MAAPRATILTGRWPDFAGTCPFIRCKEVRGLCQLQQTLTRKSSNLTYLSNEIRYELDGHANYPRRISSGSYQEF